MTTMLAARLHEIGKPMQLEQIPVPAPRPTDVLVQVKACNLVPNLKNVLATYAEWFPYLPLPRLPAIFGLDSAGVVAQVGSMVTGVNVGDRVYVNPGLSCGGCRACRQGEDQNCPAYTFMGYFGFGPDAQQLFDAYPYGGLAEYLTAPQRNLVKLPGSVSFEQGAASATSAPPSRHCVRPAPDRAVPSSSTGSAEPSAWADASSRSASA
jgi:D-arabinose 1-dehydrogenase-like Zn-dependent alcohol dehydrogenase